jgi:hypothetical protein
MSESIIPLTSSWVQKYYLNGRELYEFLSPIVNVKFLVFNSLEEYAFYYIMMTGKGV